MAVVAVILLDPKIFPPTFKAPAIPAPPETINAPVVEFVETVAEFTTNEFPADGVTVTLPPEFEILLILFVMESDPLRLAMDLRAPPEVR